MVVIIMLVHQNMHLYGIEYGILLHQQLHRLEQQPTNATAFYC